MGYYDRGSWRPYVSVAERRRKAMREIQKGRKKGHALSPVVIEGRTIARTFWGKAWCDNLERYSDDPADLSTLPNYWEFDAAMAGIWSGAAQLLRDDRFAVVVMGNVREGEMLHDLAGDMTRAMEAAGLRLYMDAVLVTAIGSLALRAARNFARRKLGRTHQQVLVYLKGEVDRALEALGELEIADPAAMFGHVVEERSE